MKKIEACIISDSVQTSSLLQNLNSYCENSQAGQMLACDDSKKKCPLEMSIQAANLADEFDAGANYVQVQGDGRFIANGVVPMGMGIGVTSGSTVSTHGTLLPAFTSAGQYEFTLQPSPYQVLLVRVPNDPSGATVMVAAPIVHNSVIHHQADLMQSPASHLHAPVTSSISSLASSSLNSVVSQACAPQISPSSLTNSTPVKNFVFSAPSDVTPLSLPYFSSSASTSKQSASLNTSEDQCINSPLASNSNNLSFSPPLPFSNQVTNVQLKPPSKSSNVNSVSPLILEPQPPPSQPFETPKNLLSPPSQRLKAPPNHHRSNQLADTFQSKYLETVCYQQSTPQSILPSEESPFQQLERPTNSLLQKSLTLVSDQQSRPSSLSTILNDQRISKPIPTHQPILPKSSADVSLSQSHVGCVQVPSESPPSKNFSAQTSTAQYPSPSASVAPDTLILSEKENLICEEISLEGMTKAFASETDGQLETETRRKSEQADVEPSNSESMICEVDESSDSVANDTEGEDEPLIVRIRKIPTKRKNNTKQSFEHASPVADKMKGTKKRKNASCGAGWSDSDDEALATLRKVSYCRNMLSNVVIVLRGHHYKGGQRRESVELGDIKCCLRGCYLKVPAKNQEIAFAEFSELEKKGEGDRYLANCVQLKCELVGNGDFDETSQHQAEPKKPNFESMSVEIANESNGNQMLSDEIQNAIRESLKDQESEATLSRIKAESTDNLRLKRGTREWAYYIAVNLRLRSVCLNFVKTLLSVPQSRINALKKKILNGEGVNRLPTVLRMHKASMLWKTAKRHVDTLSKVPAPFCISTPPHQFLSNPIDKAVLFQKFRDFYKVENGSDPRITFETYKRFLQNNAELAFPRKKENVCPICNSLEATNPGREDGRNNGKSSEMSGGQGQYKGDNADKNDTSPLICHRIRPLKVKIMKSNVNKRKSSLESGHNESEPDWNRSKDCKKTKHHNEKGTKECKAMQADKTASGCKSNKTEKDKCMFGENKLKGIKSKSEDFKKKKDNNSKNSKSETFKRSVEGKVVSKGDKGKQKRRRGSGKRGDVFSLMLTHLRSMPSSTPRCCTASPLHRFFNPATITTQVLYEEYRKYFLRATNSELGLRYTIYESLLLRNPVFALGDLDYKSGDCPRCLANPSTVSTKLSAASNSNHTRNKKIKLKKLEEPIER